MRYLKTRRNFAGENNTWRKNPEADTPQGWILQSYHFLILARCVFVTQTYSCTTKTLAPKGIKSLQSRD
ncbi:hypothetical protein [Prevotella nigrescens]|uniref:hypothetical protein n=1 Tax=Prevotella nigrescens TaxID=28133 RepID=UPI001BAB3831|nr:hypothetical protein [Prevotella nigrescens]QUB50934.1 hypothetical protein J5A59_00615 [Prevotella nigrescens]